VVANPIPVDETRSLAWREHGRVHIVVHLSAPGLPSGERIVRFRHGERTFRRPAELVAAPDGGTVLRVSTPTKRLGRVAWFIALRLEGSTGTFHRVSARILAHPNLPVALLPGPPPRTILDPPQPRTSRVRGVARQSRRAGGRIKRAVTSRAGR
jgi:hypothetical protein